MRKFARLTAFMAALALLVTLFAFPAAAEDKIRYVTRYDENGTAYVALQPVDEYNTLTYTLDESVPDKNSTRYKGEIAVKSKSLLRIAEFNENGKKVRAIKMTVTPRVPTPVCTTAFENGKCKAYIYCDVLGAKIYYTTDGSLPTKNSKRLTSSITVDSKTTIRAFATYSGLRDSAKMTEVVDPNAPRVTDADAATTTPTKTDTASTDATPPATTATTATDTPATENKAKKGADYDIDSITQDVKYAYSYINEKGYVNFRMTPRTTSNTIYYTTDGTKPTKYDKQYTDRFKLTEAATVRAIECSSSGKIVGYVSVKVKMKCVPPEFTCLAITNKTYTIKITTATPGADIYFTLDGTPPEKTTSTKYTSPIIVGSGIKIRAIVSKDGYMDSVLTDATSHAVPFDTSGFDEKDTFAQEIADEVNRYRAREGLPALRTDVDLSHAAYLRTRELECFFEPTRPNGLQGISAISMYNPNYYTAREHYTVVYSDVADIVADAARSYSGKKFYYEMAWDFNAVGAARYKSANGKTYYVIMLAYLS